MKHLLRKRTNSISSPSSSAPHPINVSAPAPLGPSPASPTGETPVTPLYARFATSSKPVVSGPIALAPRRAGQAPAPTQIQRGASSQSEKEREREREQEQAVMRERERERKKSVGAEREPRGILKRDEARLGEGSRAQGRGAATREVGRKPSNGEDLLVPSTSTSGNGHAGEDTVGMHGARVRGERVLLPARKVTQRRRGEEAASALETPARTREDQQARSRRENSPVKSGAEGDGGYPKEHPPHARSTGDRVLLPARKVTRRRVNDDGGPAQADPAASASGRPLADSIKEASVSSSRPSQEAAAAAPIVFLAPARGAVVAASTDHDDGEDQFSTPKRAHMTPMSSPGMASSSPSASSEPPRPALGTPKDSESSRITRAAGSSTICPPSSQGPANAAIESEARVVGDRVLLPARKVARRIVEGEKEKERSPERGRTMSTGRSSIRQEKGVTASSTAGASDLEAGQQASPAAKTTHLNVFPAPAPSRSASPSRSARGIAPGPEHAASALSTSKPVAPSLTSQPSTSSVETNGRPPRRRKYSLLAAFGLPSRGASESESSTPAASTDVHSAKPPTPTPPPPPPDPAPLAPTAVDVQPPVTSPSTRSGPDSAGEPRQRLASTARRPPPEVQLHSLHLSGFNFSLDALLGDATCPILDDPPPMPPVPASQPSPATVSKRRSTVDSLPVPASSSPPDPPVPVTGTASPLQPSASLGHASKAQSPSLPSQPAAAPHPEPPARPAHAPIQAPKTQTKTRAIDLDQSLLSPESDTRYPLPSRRSPTSQPRLQKPPTRSSPMKSEQPVAVPNARGPVQGRPLIFAAMATAEAEAEVVEPRMWMAVPTSDSDSQDDGDVKDVRTEHSNGSSQFVNGYPTPRSASPRLPAATSSDDGHGTPALATSTNVRAGREDDVRRPSPSLPQSPPTATGILPSPPDPQPTRSRKLSKSKSRVTRMADASQVPSQPPTQTPSHSLSYGHAPNTLGAKPPTPVEDAPPVRTRDGPSKSVPKPSPVSSNGASSNPSLSTTTSLASPFQMRGDKHAMERRHVESRSPPRVISSESPVPTRPVKMLTERQMEKLSATKGVAMHGSNGHSSQRRPEQSGPHVKSPTPRNKQLTPLTPPDEPPAVQHSRSRSSDDSLPPSPPKRRPADVSVSSPRPDKTSLPEPPHSPTTPEEYARARSRRRGQALEKSRPEGIEDVTPAPDEPAEEEPKEPTFYPLEKHVAEPALLGQLVGYLPFSDWLALSSVSKTIRSLVHGDRELAERVMERYLRTVGYARWSFPESEPISLTLADLNAYMHAVSLPQHQFARYADMYLHDRRQREVVQLLQAACRSYTRVVLRLRAQAEAEARVASAVARDRARSPARGWGASTTSVNHVPTPKKSFSRSSSRAPSPTSMYSRSQHGHGYVHSRAGSEPSLHHNPSVAQFHGPGSPPMNSIFQSPLFRIRRAPLLQVFVPSPEGEWLSDASVLKCEEELKRAGVTHLLRAGDIVWDIAVGDEANVGRMAWDGSYLIDLDYTYSRSGDLPKYLPTLAFPPSYFHRVVRTMGSGNPICHIDIAPWGEEIATNLQLLQDRMKTETPQGGHHMVVRWVHRSSFTIRPSSSGKALRVSVPQCVGPGPGPGGIWLIDPGWYGTVVVEAEGTNEGLADLQERCRGAFPIRAMGAAAHISVSPERAAREEERRMVFRILREKSRPGEIWIRTVTAKERLLPP